MLFPIVYKSHFFCWLLFCVIFQTIPFSNETSLFLMHFQRDLSSDHTHTRQISSILITPLEEITRASISEPFPKLFCSSDFSVSNALFLIHYRNLSQYVSICFSSFLFSLQNDIRKETLQQDCFDPSFSDRVLHLS